MRPVTIARNYADALLVLADKAGATEQWGDLIDATAAAMGTPAIEAALVSPRVPKDRKVAIVAEALATAPPPFKLFVVAVVKRGRQLLLGMIADEYRALVDQKLGRVRAGITLARDVDPLARQVISERLAAAIGKEVIAGFAVDPAILGGTIVRIGDRIYDGSVRKRLGRLRNQLLTS
ncbi:MAG: ATP synthase F1 subunit delta [Gemmatimonadales bacterium]|nr:ATP synthase F1 subunit delta [Gemmatimonadales bacterium]